MFDFVSRNKRLIQGMLFLIFIPFAFFWVGDYVKDAGPGRPVAQVGGYSISQEEFNQALRERQQAVHRALEGQRVDPAMLDNPELRQAVLEGLVQRRLLVERALRLGIAVPEQQLKGVIAGMQLFHDGSGRFSYERYQEFLRSEGMTPASFEARLRHDMLIRQLSEGYAESGFVPRTVAGSVARLLGEQREVSHVTIAPEGFLARVKLAPEAAKQYYDANIAEFRTPEQARVEYVVLSLDSLAQAIQVDPAEVKQYYDGNQRQFGVAEVRHAAHILFAAGKGEGEEARQKARAAAESLHAALVKNPAGFAEAAKKHSQDPGSAERGGDIGTVGRGSMKDVPEFERALFQLSRPGEISPPVETRHGYHIIRLLAIQPARVRPLEEVRGQIEADLKKSHAGRLFAELAEKFNNTVYEQSDSLGPAAQLLKTEVRQSGWLTRGQGEPPLDNARLLAAIFSDEVLKDKRNTEAIETAPGVLVAARVIESRPASVRPFESVQADIAKRLSLREAARLAAEEGRQLLDGLAKGKPVKLAWSEPQMVSREDGKDLPEPVLRQAFRMDVSTLPAYSGLDSPRGAFILLRVTRRVEPGDIPAEKAGEVAAQLRQVLGREQFAAYVASLKQRSAVKVNLDRVIEGRDDAGPASPKRR
jgi:peptidyl-prolyl cis-trans isomerase D